jgi:hypothetical protein
LSQPQPVPYYQPPPPSTHTHTAYIIAIVLLAVLLPIFGVIGFFAGVGSNISPTSPQPQSPQFTFTHGIVRMSQLNPGIAVAIKFDSQHTGTLGSEVYADNGYGVWLPTGITYTITVHWLNSTVGSPYYGDHQCTTQPGIFTTSGSDYTQDFLC